MTAVSPTSASGVARSSTRHATAGGLPTSWRPTTADSTPNRSPSTQVLHGALPGCDCRRSRGSGGGIGGHGVPRRMAAVSKAVDDARDLYRQQSRLCRSLRLAAPLDGGRDARADGRADRGGALVSALALVALSVRRPHASA